ncbi:MAG: helix-turn-helix domain-containing protein [Pirellulales bacterium]
MTGIDRANLSRFLHGQQSISFGKVDRIAAVLDLHISAGDKPTAKKGR